MARKRYSIELKMALVQKLLNRGSKTVKEISEECGIMVPILHRWVREFGNIENMEKETPNRPQDRTVDNKFSIVLKYLALPEEQQGEFIRREGVHSAHLNTWIMQMKEGLMLSRNKKSPPHVQLDKKKIKELENELLRKEKALAEAAALLILKKKVENLWETKEE